MSLERTTSNTDTLFSVFSDTSTIVPARDAAPEVQARGDGRRPSLADKLKAKISPPNPALERLVAEGFDRALAKRALGRLNNDEERARFGLTHLRDHKARLDPNCPACEFSRQPHATTTVESINYGRPLSALPPGFERMSLERHSGLPTSPEQRRG
ncbi:uncharacterized protein LOC62_07G009180 [Vanrija pseudolonga]|uniref:UBA domain-containing protein n=1 Tax=Vanrija pseudolonga TaxID=143232 RepID=A0AAF0YI81_9TREE|nr:hypothetical protein LOC62_07G009180 [Vanrija pseudolonga]